MPERKSTTSRTNRTNRRKVNAKRKAPVAANVVTTSTGVRFVEPAKTTKRRASKPKVVTIVGQTDDVVLKQVDGFANFLKEYAVVGLAVGFIAGQQANAVVKQLVDSFVNPFVQILFGTSLTDQTSTFHHGKDVVLLPWGKFLYVMLQFFFVLITIYAVIKLFKLDRFKKSDDKAKAAETVAIVEEPKKK